MRDLNACGFAVWVLLAAATAGQDATGTRLGSLAAEDSCYLRSQAGSAVRWQAWGPDAFAEAERTGKPLFVSIGYGSCLWTARMDREVFEDPETAALLNDNCVNIKIDRFQRPDIDRLCRRYAEAGGQRATWPLNLFMSSDRVPIRVAPSLDLHDDGQGCFPVEVAHIVNLWRTEGPHVRAQARIDLQALALDSAPRPDRPLEVGDAALDLATGQILGHYDPVYGGFGRVPKFPFPARLGFIAVRAARRAEGGECLDVIRTTLGTMARSGLRDHLGGGFFRYAFDEAWRRPYFEKLALDQALMADSYLLGHQLTGQNDFAAVARETLDYAVRELGHPEGGFYNAENCESHPTSSVAPREGAYYVWSRDELRRHAAGAADVMEMIFGVRERGNVPPGCDPFRTLEGGNLLSIERSIPEAAGRFGLPEAEIQSVYRRGCDSLLAARHQRPRPGLDRLIVTQINAALVSSLCRAGLQLREPAFLDRATRAADFLHARLWDASTSTLHHCLLDRAPRNAAVAEDYAFLVRALLDLHETTGEFRWVRWAAEVQSAFDRHHADLAAGGYFDTRHDAPDMPVALKSIDDEAALSPNAVAAQNLVRWSVLLQDSARADSARRLLSAFAAPLQAGSASVAGLFRAADALVHPPGRITLLGPAGSPEARAARALIAAAPPGRWLVLTVEDAAARRWLADRQALPLSAAGHPLDVAAFVLAGAPGAEKGPRPLNELHKSLE